MASRLTSIARPGKVLVDQGLAEALRDDERFRLRRTRRTSVKGYRRLEPWKLRRPRRDEQSASAAAYLEEKGEDLLRAVDEVQARLERRASGREGAQQRPGRQPRHPVAGCRRRTTGEIVPPGA